MTGYNIFDLSYLQNIQYQDVFWEVYVKLMQQTTIDEHNSWLSCDHTFASAGTPKHWVT
jgi:hypothetical protein